jgi:hypothetical protein
MEKRHGAGLAFFSILLTRELRNPTCAPVSFLQGKCRRSLPEIIASNEDPGVIEKILKHLGLDEALQAGA